jgi:GTP-binding protein
MKEMHTDVSLRIEKTDKAEVFSVAGRGELHLAVIIEKLRREGIEFQVSRPQIIVKEIDGKKMEPYELLFVETPEEHLGAVMDLLSRKKADMIDMANIGGNVKIKYEIPSRGVIGLRTDFLTETRGTEF